MMIKCNNKLRIPELEDSDKKYELKRTPRNVEKEDNSEKINWEFKHTFLASLYSRISWWSVSQYGTHSINPLFGAKGMTA